MMIYFDNASTTQMLNSALDSIVENLKLFGNPSASYQIALQTKRKIEKSREIISMCLNCNKDSIIFTSGGTEGNNWVFNKFKNRLNKCKIITTEFEHSSVLEVVEELKENSDYEVIYLKPDKNGFILPETLMNVMDEKVALVSIMYVNNEIGSVQNIEELCKIAHSYGALFHTDAVQAIGHFPVDIEKLGVDFLSCSAHKFGGPKGIGFLFVKDYSIINPLFLGGGQERGLRSGTESVLLIDSMAAALNEMHELISDNMNTIECLKRYFISSLENNNVNYKINGNNNGSSIINIMFPYVDNEALVNYLDLHDICISYGSACSTGELEPSHVLKSIGLSDDDANSSVRISFSHKNTLKEIDELIYWLKKYL